MTEIQLIANSFWRMLSTYFTSKDQRKADELIYTVFHCEHNESLSFEVFDQIFIEEKIKQYSISPPSPQFILKAT